METNISLYQNLTLIFGIAGGIMLVLSIALFIIYDMKHVIGKTLGLSEKQAIKRMNTRAKAEEKAWKKKKTLAAEGGGIDKAAVGSSGSDAASGRSAASGQEDEATDVLAVEPGTEDGATDVLAVETETEDGATDVLAVSEKGVSDRTFTDAPEGWEPIETGDTTVLNENPATAVLSVNNPTIKNTQFMLIRHIMLIHTEEII